MSTGLGIGLALALAASFHCYQSGVKVERTPGTTVEIRGGWVTVAADSTVVICCPKVTR